MQGEQILDYNRPLTQPPPSRSGAVLPWLILAAYFALTVGAVFALHIPGVGVRGQELSLRRTVFAAVNATTLTGFQQDVGSSLARADVLRLVLTLGGTLFTLTLGGMAVVRVARMNYTDGQVARGAAVATVAATVAGAAFLLDSERGLVAALLQSASAFGNSGLYAGRLPAVTDWRTHGVLMPLAFAGALGVPVLMELFDRITGARRLSPHSRMVLVLAAGFYLAGFVALGVLDEARATHGAPGGLPGAGWRESVGLSSATAVNARSTGLPFEFAAAFTRPAQWVLIALMIVGGAPGGAAGGLKTTTVWRIVTGVRDNLRGRHDARPFGIAASWAAIYFAIVLGGLLLLLHTEPDMPADRLLFLSVSAVSNVGLSHDPVSITGDGLFTLSAMMLLGRLAPLAVLWWMVRSNDGETVAVG